MFEVRARFIEDGSETLSITLRGKFNFSARTQFLNACQNQSVRNYELNLKEVNFIDSSGLGLLLLLKEQAAERNGFLKLVNMSNNVSELLEMTNLNQFLDVVN